MSEEQNEFEETVAGVERQLMRRIVGIATNVTDATIAFRLGCGHTVTIEIASHPVECINDINLEIGDEMDCDICEVAPWP